MAPIPSIRQLELKDKVVFLRLDLNTPIKDGAVSDDTRIRASIPTIEYALEQGAKLVLGSHLGRPKSADDKQFSLEPVASRLGELLNKEVVLIEDPLSEAPKGLVGGLKKDQIILLENLRFNSGETKNGQELPLAVAQYATVYVNDAFGASHRAHSSIVALAEALPNRGMGLLIEKEVEMLSQVVEKPTPPFVAVMGGAKVSDKIEVIERIIDKVDGFVIGGAMAYTFIKAMGLPVGRSRIEEDKISFAKDLIGRLDARGKRLLLPVDHIVVDDFANPQEISAVDAIPMERLGVDIGPKSIDLFQTYLKTAKTVFWNGPMGVFEDERFSKGSFAIAETMAAMSDAVTVVGGGDSAAAANLSGYADQMSHISTGGGASLEFLQGQSLPGLKALLPPKRSEDV